MRWTRAVERVDERLGAGTRLCYHVRSRSASGGLIEVIKNIAIRNSPMDD